MASTIAPRSTLTEADLRAEGSIFYLPDLLSRIIKYCFLLPPSLPRFHFLWQQKLSDVQYTSLSLDPTRIQHEPRLRR
jgi:hypothetical protein